MRNEFTGIVERDGDWFVAYCLEIPGANGQGRTREDALANLSEAIALILEDRREDGLRGLPDDATKDIVTID
jgi:predicted RNase H-like HicB family nuclease